MGALLTLQIPEGSSSVPWAEFLGPRFLGGAKLC